MMSNPSDEILNALVDGELAPADALPLLQQMQDDGALRERLAQISLQKQLVRQAFASDAPAPEAPAAAARQPGPPAIDRLAALSRPWAGWRTAVAGMVLGVVFGALLGWGIHARWPAGQVASLLPGTAPAPHSVQGQVAGQLGQTPAAHTRIVLHVASQTPLAARATLERAEGLLQAARASGQVISVEIVANSGGLDLLRADTSSQAARLAQLRQAYPALALIACGQTAQKLRDAGQPVHLLPGTIEASSALDQIVLRLQQGWAYVRI